MTRAEGEPLIHIDKFGRIPQDASRVLAIRTRVQQELRKQGGMQSPFDDLAIEERSPDLQELGRQVVHPIVFMFPTIVLRALSQLQYLQKVDFP